MEASSVFGNCLCGKIRFEIDSEIVNLYQCHCSLCRKQSGSYSNAATIIENRSFRFVFGGNLIKSWVKETGFRSDFCSSCGSPVPNPLRNTNYYWVPAGLLEESISSNVVAHFCLASKASWAANPACGEPYNDLPNLDHVIKLLSPEKNI